MRSVFPAYFRPSDEDYKSLWSTGIFAFDANVLLNLYRYSPETRKELEISLAGVKNQLFITYQAAKEFLKNRIVVTSGQAGEYDKAIKTILDLKSTISNKKRHPFLDDGELPPFLKIADEVTKQLEAQKERLLKRLIEDEILDFVESNFSDRVGHPFSESELSKIATEGQNRYDKEIPPGYKDSNKDESGDPYRKFGDYFLWKQLIEQAKKENKPLIFITDDQKEDWWQQQSGRTIGPRPELREEFIKESGQQFWMYTVDRFISESAKHRRTVISENVIAEIIEVREEEKTKRINERSSHFRKITRDEIVSRIRNSERWAYENGIPFLGLVSYVKNYLGNAGFDYDTSFDVIKQLQTEGVIEIYDHKGPGHEHSVAAIRLQERDTFGNKPFEGLRGQIDAESGE